MRTLILTGTEIGVTSTQEKKINQKSYTLEQKKDVLTQLENKSKLEFQKTLATISPSRVPRMESVRPITEEETRVSLTLNQESELNNLRLLYKTHNRYQAIQCFGLEKIMGFQKRT